MPYATSRRLAFDDGADGAQAEVGLVDDPAADRCKRPCLSECEPP